MGLLGSENLVELGRIVSETEAFQKRYWQAGRQAGRSYSGLSAI